jgi:hypothetical protein
VPVSAWDPTPYPEPRKNRFVASPSADPGLPPDIRAPRTFLWNTTLRVTTQNNRARAASKRCIGPGIIKDFTGQFLFSIQAATRYPLAGVYWNDVPYTTNQDELAFPAPVGTPVFTHQVVRNDGLLTGQVDGFAARLSAETTAIHTWPMDYVIDASEFYLTIFVEHRGNAGESYLNGTLRIYENCDRQTIGYLLG